MNGRHVLVTGLLGIALGLAGCNNEPSPVFDPRLLQQLEAANAGEVSQPLRPLPTTREGPYIGSNSPSWREAHPTATRATTGPNLDEGPIVHLSLHEIIERAIANNHDVKVAGYQPAIEGTRVIEHQANFDPSYFATAQYQEKHDLNGGEFYNSFTGGPEFLADVQDFDQGTVQTGFQQNLSSGGQIQLQYEDIYTYYRPQQALENPFWESDLTLSLTQPLLKNFGYDVNQSQIVIARITQKISLLEFRKAVEQNASDIEKAYWQLVQAEKDIKSEEKLVAATEDMYNILNTRMRQHVDVSQLQVSQSQTELESRRAQLLQFKAHARDLSDQLKAMMSDPEYPVISDVLILPADNPIEEPMEFDLQDEIDTAMANRFELGEQQLKVDQSAVTITVAENNLLPQLDFIGSIGPEGGGTDIGTAIRSNAQFDHLDFSAGFKLTIPLGNRAAKAVYRRSILQRLQAIEQYQSTVEQVALDVKTSARAVDTAWDVIVQSRLSLYAAQDALHGINERERTTAALSPEFVQLKLDTQERLAEAEQSEDEAVASYNIALAQLERAKGTLLRYNNVLLEPDKALNEAAGLLH